MPLTDLDFDWNSHGLTPRWLEMESTDCAAALQPNTFEGGAELARFLTGAGDRDETAVLIATMGDFTDGQRRRLAARGDSAVVHLPGANQGILGTRAPQGSELSLSSELAAADRDLGLRMLNRSRDAPWWSLSLEGYYLPATLLVGEPAGAQATGTLIPILTDAAGDPVVGVWVSEARDQRWYVVPDQSDWAPILEWLVSRALPEFAPGALRRARSSLLRDPLLYTNAETAAEAELAHLAEEYEERRAAITERLDQARRQADPIRNGLLYGTGDELERVIGIVLTEAGLSVVALDDALGATSSADLLVSLGSRRRLVEIKSARGDASEAFMDRLQSHVRNWPERDRDPVEGGVLVVNHQHRLPPADRREAVYQRPEFTDHLPAPVISTLQLFEWWRTQDWTSVREAVFTD
jgi:hypothetical protein